MVGFLDDINNQTNQFNSTPQPSLDFLAKIMETDAQQWNKLLWGSGGALELSKCSSHAIGWEFRKGFPLMIGGTQAPKMTLL